MRQIFRSLQYLAQCLALCLLAAVPATALASGAGPNGINIGFDFNWSPSGPQSYSAAFINTVNGSGATLVNCTIGPLSPTSTACDFPIAFEIGGTPQTAVVPGGSYNTWPASPTSGRYCDVSGATPNNTAPLTLWNCFNDDSFGQVFMAGASGVLSNMTMPMTCLNPAGGPLHGLFAVIYQVNTSGMGSIPATPLAQIPVDLSGCPTLTSWDNHTFSAGDFAQVPLNFQNVTLEAGNFYGVFFAGSLVPGSQLPGFVPPAPAPTLGSWAMLLFSGGLALAGLLVMRRRLAR